MQGEGSAPPQVEAIAFPYLASLGVAVQLSLWGQRGRLGPSCREKQDFESVSPGRPGRQHGGLAALLYLPGDIGAAQASFLQSSVFCLLVSARGFYKSSRKTGRCFIDCPFTKNSPPLELPLQGDGTEEERGKVGLLRLTL